LKICSSCVLTESFPGIQFDESGRCQHCRGRRPAPQDRQRFEEKFRAVVREIRGSGTRDAILAYSGGKDSTITLKILKERYDLNLLAVTFDNGFISPRALENIRSVTAALDVDHLLFRPAERILHTVFAKSIHSGLYPLKSLERASAICNSCMNMVKAVLLKLSIEMNIPAVAYGWSPGQAPMAASVWRATAAMVRRSQSAARAVLYEMVGDRLDSLFLQERHYAAGFPILSTLSPSADTARPTSWQALKASGGLVRTTPTPTPPIAY
jgi:hypothetical protein